MSKKQSKKNKYNHKNNNDKMDFEFLWITVELDDCINADSYLFKPIEFEKIQQLLDSITPQCFNRESLPGWLSISVINQFLPYLKVIADDADIDDITEQLDEISDDLIISIETMISEDKLHLSKISKGVNFIDITSLKAFDKEIDTTPLLKEKHKKESTRVLLPLILSGPERRLEKWYEKLSDQNNDVFKNTDSLTESIKTAFAIEQNIKSVIVV